MFGVLNLFHFNFCILVMLHLSVCACFLLDMLNVIFCYPAGLVRPNNIAAEVLSGTSQEVSEDFPLWHPTPLR